MRTQLVHMLENTYPFGQTTQPDPNNRILIKQTLPKNSNHFQDLIRLARLAKKITQNNIFIKLQTILEEQDNLCLLYEYVPIKVSKYIKAMDEKFLKQYRYQLYQIAQILADNRIIATLDMANMGLNQKYQAKYFLGLDFVQKKQVNIYELKNDYIEEIKKIFSPFLESNALAVPKKTSKNLVKVDNRLSDTQEIQNVSSYIDSNNNFVKTRKHQSIYYQKDKDKEVNRRKESYMSSVSNLRLNNLYRRINQIQLQVCNTKTPNKSGFKFSIQGRQFTSKSSIDKKALENHKFKAIANGVTRNNHLNSTAIIPHHNNYVKYPGYDNEEDESEELSHFEEYQKSIRSNKPNRYAVKNTLEMSAHTKPQEKKQYKKFSTQFPSLSDFEPPLMALTNAMRISANGLDKQERKVNKKIELFKEREYSEMKSVSGNPNYMRDFMSVLEEETSTNERASKHNENENQSLENESISKPPVLKMASQQSIEDVEYNHFGSQKLQKNQRVPPSIQSTYTSHSHTQLPSPKPVLTPLGQSNQLMDSRIKSKMSIEQSTSNTNIHNRVKGVIENSKKLIEKLKERARQK